MRSAESGVGVDNNPAFETHIHIVCSDSFDSFASAVETRMAEGEEEEALDSRFGSAVSDGLPRDF